MTEEERELITSIVDRMNEGIFSVLRGFTKIESSKLEQETNKLNKVIGIIQTVTISDTNRLAGAVATYVGQRVELMVNDNRPGRIKEPFWKR